MDTPQPLTILTMGAVLGGFLCIVLALMRYHYPRRIRGIGMWATAIGMWLMGAVLLATRGHILLALSAITSDVLLIMGSLLFYLGCCRFYGQPGDWTRWHTGAMVTLFISLFLARAPTSAIVSGLIFALSALALDGVNLRLLLRHGNHRLPVILVQTGLAAHAVVMCLRVLWLASGRAPQDPLTQSTGQALYLSAYITTLLLACIGTVLLAMERLPADLRQLARHDPLTQALNRGALMQACHDEIGRSQRHGQSLALLMLDLDHFKRINDAHGHLFGDAVLVHFVRQLRRVLRDADVIGRYGGEEFIVLLPETDATTALGAAQRVHAALATGHVHDCQVSIGLAVWRGEGDGLDALIKRADTALYQAKRDGRNRTCVQAAPTP